MVVYVAPYHGIVVGFIASFLLGSHLVNCKRFSSTKDIQHLQQKESWSKVIDKLKHSRSIRSLDDNENDSNSDYLSFNNDWYAALLDALYKGPVCDLVDGRNHLETLDNLRNCTIVNGFVQIVLFNDLPSQSYEDLNGLEFPNLRIITEYLVIYRAYGLKSLSRMFPNLMMIGGNNLFYDKYSLLIYENPDLQEIGLHGLRYIKHGTARIENNGKLCFLDTIDWARLGKTHKNSEIAKPDIIGDQNQDGCLNQCGDDHRSCYSSDSSTGKEAQYCWGVTECQADLCPTECPYACGVEGKDANKCVCGDECLGGCTSSHNNSMESCLACRHYYHNHMCVANCPIGTVMIHDWRCIPVADCLEDKWLVHDGECIPRCPKGHNVAEGQDVIYCEKCDGVCVKECIFKNPYTVDSKESLKEIHRCTILKSQLIITINGGTEIIKDLEESLGELQEVGALVIRRSFPLISLSFLKSLKRITGEDDYLHHQGANGYSLYVLDNMNLKELWDFENNKENANLTIEGGKAFFHFNPYLCRDKIDKILNLTALEEDPNDVSISTNGERAACTVEKITNISTTSDDDGSGTSVRFEWLSANIKDHRTLIGYQVYYRKSKYKNATRYQGVDACGTSSWYIQEVTIGSKLHNEESLVFTVVQNLAPFTQYAYYIVAYTTSTAMKGAMSDIRYVTTPPSRPGSPHSVKVTSGNSSSVFVEWQPPVDPNGHIMHYKIGWRRQPDDYMIRGIEDRNVCNLEGRISRLPSILIPPPTAETETGQVSQGACSCKETVIRDTEQLVESQIFEDFLIGKIIHSVDSLLVDDTFLDDIDQNSKRKKRNIENAIGSRYRRRSLNDSYNSTSAPSLNTSTVLPTVISPTASSVALLNTTTVNSTHFTITGLHHFMDYYIEIIACNHAHLDVGCSLPAITHQRTKKLDNADKINDSSFGFDKDKSKRLDFHWMPPKNPNSFIKHYTLHYETVEGEIRKNNQCCPAGHANYEVHCSLSDLRPGKYRAKVLPVSLAAAGLWSKEVSFVIDEESIIHLSSTAVIVIIVVSTIFLIPILLIVYFFWKRYTVTTTPQIYASVNPEYSTVWVYEPDEYEIAADDVKLLREIGHGHFGKVFEGLARNVIRDQDETKVAVKTLHGNESIPKRIEFLKEASVMKAFNSHHVVRLLGVVSSTDQPMVVMEYMELGDLKTYLRCTRPDAEEKHGDPPTLQQKLQMCGEVADGMAYLSATKYVHRDLAARNCLVRNDLTVKIGDFGLTRDVYETDYYRIDSKGILPVRWMAPESLKDGVFDSRSDVWSYGVVLWEIATLAEQPYQGQQHDQVTRYVIDGGYMEQPKSCPKKLYDLMLMCWHYSPSMRPTFMEIVASLSPDLSDNFRTVSYFYEPKENATEGSNEEEAFLGGSHRSTESEMYSSSDNHIKGEAQLIPNSRGSDPDAYLHLNGGHQNEHTSNSAGRDVANGREDSTRYVPLHVQTRRTPTIC